MLIKELSEAQMNPTSFAASLKTAGSKNVLIGYEFEVCVPKKTLKKGKTEQSYEERLDKLFNDYTIFDDLAFRRYQNGYFIPLAKFDELFKVNPARAKHKNFKELVKSLKPEEIEDYYVSYGELVEKMFEVPLASTIENNLREYFIIDNAKKVFKYLTTHGDEYWGGEDEEDKIYNQAAHAVKAVLQPTMNSDVQIFTSYHAAPKSLDRWYIEPDGSLEPKDNDGAVEIVSPPLNADDAIDTLKKFYAMAKSLNLYTGAQYDTGLHINVSIPDNLDLLKLAVFLGDTYALEKFGREDSQYAKSVIEKLINRTPNIYQTKNYTTMPTSRGKKSKLFPNSKMKKTTLDTGLLKTIADNATRDHVASISYNGKYVSFRHAGGDYLKDYNSVLNIVGRFVQAMIIASDENMYKEEYLKKLVKLFGREIPGKYQKTQNDNIYPKLRTLLQNMKTRKLPVIELSIALPLPKDHPRAIRLYDNMLIELANNVIRWHYDFPISSYYSYFSHDSDIEKNSSAAMQNMKDLGSILPVENFFLVTMYPTRNMNYLSDIYDNNMHELRTPRNDTYSTGTGIEVKTKVKRLPFTDPRAQAFYNKVKNSVMQK